MIAESVTGPTTYHVEGGVHVKSWAADVDEATLEQARNLAKLPFAIGHVALMPDAHLGYGMPIGGVLFADNAVVPNAVGVDIGCGVTLLETEVYADDVSREDVLKLLLQISRDVPVGNGPQAQHRAPQGERFSYVGTTSSAASAAIMTAEVQLGTLGGGNHFLEIQRRESDGKVVAMIHSGSRSVGKKICDYWHGVATDLATRGAFDLPDRDLAYLPWDTDEARGYWADMSAALEWAEENRRRMAGKVVFAFGRVLAAHAWQSIDVHHNYAAWENHLGRNGVVHRKGAVRARVDDLVLIPGSMGTVSHYGVGLGNISSFETCQHGAGRAMSRGGARRAMKGRDLQADLGATVLLTPSRDGAVDEAPLAYKDIDVVMAASRDLVTSTDVMRPLGVLKG